MMYLRLPFFVDTPLRVRRLSSLGTAWIALVLGLLACQPAAEPPPAPAPPNVILIMADDMGHEVVNAFGGTSYETPNLNQMAQEGMRFDNCFSTPLCTPSRVQLMTGKYNFRNYIGFGLLAPGEQTFGHLMRAAGYETCIVGKWQLYGNERQRELAGRGGVRPEQAGFDRFCLWQVEDRGFRFKDPTLESSEDGLQTYEGAYGPDIFLDYLTDFMEEQRDTSFFAYYPMCLTHDPFLPTPDMEAFEAYDPESRTNDTTYFRNMAHYADSIVGQIRDRVAELGLAENTLILFIGDNGTDRDVVSYKGELRVPGRKGYPVEWGTHVPFVAYWPGTIEGGVVNESLVDFTDFLPSILEVAGQQLPEGFLTDGTSFAAQLKGQPSDARDWIYCHYDPRWGRFPESTYAQDKRWKLYSDGRFYDFREDPLEESPLEAATLSETAKAARGRLQQVLVEMENKKKEGS